MLIKILYLDLLEVGDPRADEIYRKHIEIITEGSFKENGNPDKCSLEGFKREFLKVYKSISLSSFDPRLSLVPVGTDGGILDGAHRMACALKLGLNVEVLPIDAQTKTYDSEFFIKNGMPIEWCELAVKNALRYFPNVFVACVWAGHEACKELEKHVDIIYSKKVKSDIRSVKNLVIEFYGQEEWIGSLNNGFSGADGKVEPCLSKDGNLYLVWFKCSRSILDLKDTVREKFGLGKHSIHITDTAEECVGHSDFLLSEAFEHIIHRFDFDSRFSVLALKMLKESREKISEGVISGSCLWALSNYREASDIDFITKRTVTQDQETHNCYESFFPVPIEALIDKNLYSFKFMGFRFLDFFPIVWMKEKRGEPKDKLDLNLINEKKTCLWDKFSGHYIYIRMRSKFLLVKLLKALGLLEYAILIKSKVAKWNR
ncbi:hypothetical protein [Gallaecimonas sp. GXIMD4217]|uniref:hypothetical protein n=1 Tax=Gallaecimonas sp. GXIMD4217 TaxID=3131927 RepID=UPI00311AEA71